MPDLHPRLRPATPADLDDLCALETTCFEPARRSSRRVLHRSLHSPRQAVWVLDADGTLLGNLTLWHHQHRTRIYALAIHPTLQGHGHGDALLDHAEQEATQRGVPRIVLEADADRPRLLDWYERRGYQRIRLHPNYYAPGHGAWRMEKRLHNP